MCYDESGGKMKRLVRKQCPEEKASFVSRVLYWWLNRLFVTGYKRPLEDEDLWELSEPIKTSNVINRVRKEWKREMYQHHHSTDPSTSSDKESEKFHNINVQHAPHIKPSLVRVLAKVFMPKFLQATLLKLMQDVFVFMAPVLLRFLIEYIEDKETSSSDMWKGYAYAVGLLIVSMFKATFLQYYFHVMDIVGFWVRSAVIGLVYEKTIILSSASRKKCTVGGMVNLMSVDAQRLMELMMYIQVLWSAPLQISIAIYFLYTTMGVSILGGVAVMILLIPVSVFVTRLSGQLQTKQMNEKDDRIKLMNEILSGIKVLKLYAWEESFINKITEIRKREVKYLKRAAFLNASFDFSFSCAPFLVSLATFAIYVLTGNELTAAKTFVAISLFNILRFPLSMLPDIIFNMALARVSIKRLTEFLVLQELDPDNVQRNMPSYASSLSIYVSRAKFSWSKEDSAALSDINLSVRSGSLLAVVGQVGCGKSTLLSSLLGETEKLQGDVYVKGSVAYVPQQAWIQNATVRDNILFGGQFDQRKYWKVVEACALKTDLDILPAGDSTEIGERGINLSGGQKQRISLARAVYFDADVYLLDDPLSAVDAYVGKHIFDEVIGPRGMLMKKTRVLVTHGISFLPQVDQIVVIQNGQITEVGTYSQLRANQGAFAEFLDEYAAQHQEEEMGTEGLITKRNGTNLNSTSTDTLEDNVGTSFNPSATLDTNLSRSSSEQNQEHRRNLGVQDDNDDNISLDTVAECFVGGDFHDKEYQGNSQESLGNVSGEVGRSQNTDSLDPVAGNLCVSQFEGDHDKESEGLLFCAEEIVRKRTWSNVSCETVGECFIDEMDNRDIARTTVEERSQTGRVKFSILLFYLKSAGLLLSLAVLVLAALMESCTVASGIWLAKWSSANVTSASERDRYLGIYAGIGVTEVFFVLLTCLTVALGAVTASLTLHNGLHTNIMHSPMLFFETTPLGRIVNRFSQDVYVIDETIRRAVSDILMSAFPLLGVIVVVSYVTPLFLTVVLPLGLLYAFIQRVYVATSRQLKRIESVSRSPIYNHFFETINGTSCIRAFSHQSRFIRDNFNKVDTNLEALYPSRACNRWLGMHLEFVGNCFIFFAALFAVVNRKELDPGLAGLSIAFSFEIISSLHWMVRQAGELETHLVSVERVKEYTATPTEAEWINQESRPQDNWPSEGRILIENFDLRYREGLPLVLKNINCHIKPGEKIGIVGRTGAGKSTLTLALFRILESDGGKVVVDGIDISKIGLQDLRSKFAIIPQDPVLFSGTLRVNLDPFDEHSDQELWRVLELSHLQTFCSGLAEGLHYPIAEGGENLSVGQRQLVCLARALLRHSKLLVLDEATAAVDLETDDVIQQTIRREFADRTVLTIAHRLNTIMDYDRIMVLDNGLIVEMDSPENLIARKGLFYHLVREAGLA